MQLKISIILWMDTRRDDLLHSSLSAFVVFRPVGDSFLASFDASFPLGILVSKALGLLLCRQAAPSSDFVVVDRTAPSTTCPSFNGDDDSPHSPVPCKLVASLLVAPTSNTVMQKLITVRGSTW